MSRPQNPGELLRLLEQLREGAATLGSAVFAGNLKRFARVPGVHISTISRVRTGDDSSPLYRVGVLIAALSVAGQGRETAQLIVDWLQTIVHRLWPAAQLPTSQLSQLEQQCDGDETNYQLAYAAGDHSVRSEWIASLRREHATVGALIAALEAEEAAETQVRVHERYDGDEAIERRALRPAPVAPRAPARAAAYV